MRRRRWRRRRRLGSSKSGCRRAHRGRRPRRLRGGRGVRPFDAAGGPSAGRRSPRGTVKAPVPGAPAERADVVVGWRHVADRRLHGDREAAPSMGRGPAGARARAGGAAPPEARADVRSRCSRLAAGRPPSRPRDPDLGSGREPGSTNREGSPRSFRASIFLPGRLIREVFTRRPTTELTGWQGPSSPAFSPLCSRCFRSPPAVPVPRTFRAFPSSSRLQDDVGRRTRALLGASGGARRTNSASLRGGARARVSRTCRRALPSALAQYSWEARPAR